jgi:hypothetical protein
VVDGEIGVLEKVTREKNKIVLYIENEGEICKGPESPATGDAAEVEAAWAAEIERRCAALDAGTTGTTDWKDLRRQIKVEILRK